MGLKQSIIVKNEFTCKTPNGGTRGGSPGSYIIDYMSRGGATEVLTPVRRSDDQNYILNYMLREEAAKDAESVPELKHDFYELSGLGGKAFGYGEVSLSDASLRKAASDVDIQFKSGKTVLKTVISFEEEYLREMGIIRPDFHLQFPGDYHGNIDQLKLRMAIMNGLTKASRGYDDLQYVGVIQIDTAHVHCHLAMYDKGVGTIMQDGTQRGKMTDRAKRDLRRGVDMYLEEKQSVIQMTSTVGYHKQNTVGFVKRFTHQAISNRGLAQFMISCLPEDKNLWFSDVQVPQMQKPHEIVKSYVQNIFAMPESGYQAAIQNIYEYAYRHGGYTRAIILEKQHQIMTDSMNVVYDSLRQISDDERIIKTPLLGVMSLEYKDAADYAGVTNSNAVAEFGFKLRSYKNRLDYHSAEFQKYHESRMNYEQQMISPNPAERPTEQSRAMYDYYRMEEEYNEMLMSKYLHFLDFVPPEQEYENDIKELWQLDRRRSNLERMLHDASIFRFSANMAEQYGQRVYDIPGGQYVISDPDKLYQELDYMKTEYGHMRDQCEVKLSIRGFQLTEDDKVVRGHKYVFDEVKSLDLHHMEYDFPRDFQIPKEQSDRFVKVADRRLEIYNKAKDYLVASDQEEMLYHLSGPDIVKQQDFAKQFRYTGQIQTARQQIWLPPKQMGTIRLDDHFYVHQEEEIREEIKSVVENTVLSLQYE